MNRVGPLSLKDNTLGCGHFKKPKKRRHRNKFRNSSLRKNRQKKFYSQKKQNSSKLNSFKFNPDSVKIMSNWYWANYKKAVEWQDRHKLAHWKACAFALMEENRYLLQLINNMQPGMVPEVSGTRSSLGKGINCSKAEFEVNPFENATNVHTCGAQIYNDETDEEESERDENCKEYNLHGDAHDDDVDDDDDDDDDDDIEFEMSEEMIQFFEQSYKHKMDLKKIREKELLNKAEEEVKQMQTNKIKRSTEMNSLYGDGASMIIGMETAVQLSFDKYCDTKSPKYWPNIPFRL